MARVSESDAIKNVRRWAQVLRCIHVRRRDASTKVCWPVRGGLRARVRFEEDELHVARALFVLLYGAPPDGFEIATRCGRACGNPAHLVVRRQGATGKHRRWGVAA